MHIGGHKSQPRGLCLEWGGRGGPWTTGVHLRAALEALQSEGPAMSGPRKCCQLERYQEAISSTRTSSKTGNREKCLNA